MKKFFYLALFFLFLFNFNNQEIEAQKQVFKSGEVVDSEIQKAKILQWDQNRSSYIIEFDVVNNIDLSQKNIHYFLEIFDSSKEQGRFLVDRSVYDDLIDLSPNGAVNKKIEYTLPTSLQKEYELQLVLVTDKGFEFDRLTLGQISQRNPQGIFIDVTQCQSKYDFQRNHIFKKIDLTESNSFEIECKNVENLNQEDLNFTPKVLIRGENVYDQPVETKNLESQTMKFEGKNDLSFTIKVNGDELTKHESELFLTNEAGEMISNKVFFSYNSEKIEKEEENLNGGPVEDISFLNQIKDFFTVNIMIVLFLSIVVVFVIIIVIRIL